MGIQYGHLQQDRSRYREHVRSQWKAGGDESWKKKPSRSTSVAKDRDKIRKRLTCIAPLDPYNYEIHVEDEAAGGCVPAIG